jgi:hypothetical protein
MAHIENLNQENQEELSKLLSKMHENNPKLTWHFHPMNEPATLKAEEANIDLEIIEKKIDALERKLDLIFGNHVLVKGSFMQIK